MIHAGDCLKVMAGMDADSIDAIVTDPPYGLGFMGKGWDHAVPGVEYWAECLRVAKPGAHLVAFGGTRLYHRLTCAIEDAGWEVRDCLSWLYGSGFPKSHNLKGDWSGWGTALKPAWEPIVLARKPLVGTVAANVTEHGTGAVNVDGCRIDGTKGVPASPRRAEQNAAYGDLSNDPGTGSGWDPNTGRWPANLILDAEAGARLDAEADSNPSRFFYCPKASKADRNAGGVENRHPTVKPHDLMKWLCQLVTPPGGTVLDPFCGSGSAGRGALAEGFEFVGIELDPEMADIARARVESERAPLYSTEGEE